jgi:hypothetical protein
MIGTDDNTPSEENPMIPIHIYAIATSIMPKDKKGNVIDPITCDRVAESLWAMKKVAVEEYIKKIQTPVWAVDDPWKGITS